MRVKLTNPDLFTWFDRPNTLIHNILKEKKDESYSQEFVDNLLNKFYEFKKHSEDIIKESIKLLTPEGF
jgi:hypothetical protein